MTKGNGLATAETLLGKKATRYIVVEIGGERYRLRSLTAREMRRFRDSLYDDQDEPIMDRMTRVHELLICHCLVDGDGKPILNEDVLTRFEEVDASTLNKLGQAAVDHSGWRTDYDIEKVESLVKN